MLTEANLRVTFDAAATIHGPCIACGSSTNRKDLIVIGRRQNGDLIRRPRCIDLCEPPLLIRRPRCIDLCELLQSEDDALAVQISEAERKWKADQAEQADAVERKWRSDRAREAQEADDALYAQIQQEAEDARFLGAMFILVAPHVWNRLFHRCAQQCRDLSIPLYSQCLMIPTRLGPVEIRSHTHG